ncbi:hypothetical protein WMY93_032494 [Mugilogobius chulae]|uniref:Uncharacterized protein n=1 Tax=Mugilogobius chulae TaxID=88201 RepID=A0AAW0MJI9_9GOBI
MTVKLSESIRQAQPVSPDGHQQFRPEERRYIRTSVKDPRRLPKNHWSLGKQDVQGQAAYECQLETATIEESEMDLSLANGKYHRRSSHSGDLLVDFQSRTVRPASEETCQRAGDKPQRKLRLRTKNRKGFVKDLGQDSGGFGKRTKYIS